MMKNIKKTKKVLTYYFSASYPSNYFKGKEELVFKLIENKSENNYFHELRVTPYGRDGGNTDVFEFKSVHQNKSHSRLYKRNIPGAKFYLCTGDIVYNPKRRISSGFESNKLLFIASVYHRKIEVLIQDVHGYPTQDEQYKLFDKWVESKYDFVC